MIYENFCSVRFFQISYINFVPSQLLNELSYKVPVDQVLCQFKNLTKSDQPRPSSSICLEVMCVQKWCAVFFCMIIKKILCNHIVMQSFNTISMRMHLAKKKEKKCKEKKEEVFFNFCYFCFVFCFFLFVIFLRDNSIREIGYLEDIHM